MDDRFPIEEVLEGSDIAGLDPLQVREVIALLARPRVALETPKLAGEWAKIALGLSGIEVPERDAQYGDSAWRDHPLFRRLAQGHLAWTQWIEAMTDNPDSAWENRERGRYVTNIVTGATRPEKNCAPRPAW